MDTKNRTSLETRACARAYVDKDEKMTIALPVFEDPEIVVKFIEGNKEILEKYPLIVIDRKG